jgi:exosortase/archaeosortase family protein
VLIDAPCAGIGMLWIGSYTAALLSYLQGANTRTTLINGIAAALLVLVANIVRNTVLFFPESGLALWPAWSHEAVGLATFVTAIVPLVVFCGAMSRSTR